MLLRGTARGASPEPPSADPTTQKIEDARKRQQDFRGPTTEDTPTDRAEPHQEFAEAPLLFMERSYFAIGPARIPHRLIDERAGGTPLVFEAQPVLHIFLWNRINKLTAIKETDPEYYRIYNTPLAFSLTFNPIVRMLALDSNPVRSPSWRIRANLQYFLLTRWGGKKLKAQLTGFRLSLGHHSNGQEHCPFASDSKLGDPCPAFDYDHPDLTRVNRVDGDFGLNHLTLAVHERWVTTRSLAPGTNLMSEHHSHSIGILGERFLGGPGGQSVQQAKLYGGGRVRGEYAFEQAFGRWTQVLGSNPTGRFQGSGFGEYVFGTGSGVTPWRLGGEVSYTFDTLGGFGVFASAFAGQDYYNLLFVDRIKQLLVGFVLDFYPRPKYACPGDDQSCQLPRDRKGGVAPRPE